MKEEIIEKIKQLQEFLEADLYTKFKPEIIIKGKTWVREDQIEIEQDFYDYLDEHFNILIKQIEEILI
jgi:Asp-tRNA(Asn)/Glu-tRNA(Gln) amidotransferase C subunit